MKMKVSSEFRAVSLPDCASDPEEKEVSDDDDDDRNHKHRKREISSQSMEGDRQEQYFSTPYRKRARPFDKGHLSKESNFQPHYSMDGEFSSRFEKQRHSMTNVSRFPLDPNQRHPSFSGDLGSSRGRSRDSGSWSQPDSRFNRFDIASQMVPPGPIPPVFSGRGQNGPWAGGFGLIPGMPNGAIDPIHPLGLQGPLMPALDPSLNFSVPRQFCRDFEERGFCLRGDMCPMEHGVNRIVVEDVQSLSQYNLPVSLPSSRQMGNPSGSSLDPQVNASPSSLINNNEFGIDAGGLNGSGADVYDPDQPLWNIDCPQTSTELLSLQAPASFMESDPSSQHTSLSVSRRRNSSERLLSRDKVDSRVNSSEFGSGTKEKRAVYTNKKTADSDSSSKLQNQTGHPFKNPAQKALRSLYVNHIPLEDNKKEALLSHFKKFGEVIDMYIPPNTEQAFVQFSKTEEAERALKSPDAVMGNRFIRLMWAYRDSNFPGSFGRNNVRKENIQQGIPKVSAPYSAGSSRNSSNEAKPPITNGPKTAVAPPVQKKLENLEVLKEELRKKQEMLEKRRKEFSQQLHKLQKNTTGIKGEGPEVQPSKKLKVEGSDGSPKSETPKNSKLQVAAVDMPAGGLLHKPQPVENETLQSIKAKFSAASQELSYLKHAARPLAFVGSPYPTNRYKLDNRPTSFRVNAPLPTEFANVNAIRDHFAVFGDLSSVDLENSDVQGDDNKHSETTKNTSARVSFKTRQAAEKAFVNGKSWNGHSLQLTWLMSTKQPSGRTKDNSAPPSKNSSGEKGSSVSVAKEASGTEIQSMEKRACDISQESCGEEAQSADKSTASGPGSTDSEVVVEKENHESVKSDVARETGENEEEAG